MGNIKMKIEGTELLIKIDLSQELGRSKNGKGPSMNIASTYGNQIIKDNIRLGINCYKPVTA